MRRREGKILYDSAKVDQVAGARSGLRSGRSLLFHSPEAAVDLLVHTGSDGLCFLQGMLSDSGDASPIPDARVRLDRQDKAVETDEYGEFALSTLSPRGDLVVRVENAGIELVCKIPNAGIPVL